MKKSTFFYFLLFGLINFIPLNAQQQITIGSGTSTWYYSPITRLFEYGASETIYDASEIGVTGTINSVGWNIVSSAYATPTGNVSIYMKMSTQSTITTTTNTTGYTLVYTGNVNNDVLGWQNITLTTPFQYNDSTKNLAVLVVHASGNYTLSPPNYAYSNVPDKSSYYYSISNAWNETRTMIATPNRTNIRLSFGNLSTVEIDGKASVKYYPNPVKDIFNISGSQSIASVDFYNLSGQNVLSQKFDSKDISINLSRLTTGNYLAKINYKDGSSKTVKVIKQ
ncbi:MULTISPECIES: T9SS type A sorting domain-containing protein [Chryseobacterium]|uniref:Por secretion system C-terminal sorting domain n=1 Tax=Chryseobacterium taihuense TaxID=1141221 RepID=A0A4U8WL37_9FLAO|nr:MULTISPECIES: T9SS type A sorting domain-containing protein [Chryseobacterium]QQV03186.1 T9SS type A sorting domain-containing protein [Chryseobacterium sp. FDAARGOS 1104]VFB03508.1 Por secretion system C-terminal sorting domain [Chryseobacterium taihuense]